MSYVISVINMKTFPLFDILKFSTNKQHLSSTWDCLESEENFYSQIQITRSEGKYKLESRQFLCDDLIL